MDFGEELERETGVALGHRVGNQLASRQVKALGFYPWVCCGAMWRRFRYAVSFWNLRHATTPSNIGWRGRACVYACVCECVCGFKFTKRKPNNNNINGETYEISLLVLLVSVYRIHVCAAQLLLLPRTGPIRGRDSGHQSTHPFFC